MLVIKDLVVCYGAIEALHGISLHIDKGEIVAMIGSNGAGKSTLLKTISGLVRPSKGSVIYEGTPLEKVPPNKIVEMGICQVPEGRRIFSSMTVRENLEIGAYLPKNHGSAKESMDKAFSLFPRLAERQKQEAGTLSGGEQQMLAIGRALMANPRLLLLDEPSLGLAPVIVEEVYRAIGEIQKSGTPILLVEQNAYQALNIADRGYVIETGNLTLEDSGMALLENNAVKQAYLGE